MVLLILLYLFECEQNVGTKNKFKFAKQNYKVMNQMLDFSVVAKQKKSENKKFFNKLKQHPPKDLDRQMQKIHQQISDKTDCLSCANCCKTTGPLFTTTDIERISGYLKLKPQDFVNRYLRTDEDGDMVLQTLPCPFLDEHNYCWIYHIRPKACKEYPHTDRKKIYKISEITIKNTTICPIAYKVVEQMKILWK